MVITATSRAGNKGFTLIELVIVLLILGIASTVVIISVANEYGKSVIKYEARKIYSALTFSREQSITRHAVVRFAPYEDGRGYSVFSDEKTFFDRTFPDGISVEAEEISFYPLGDSTGGTITVFDERGRKYEILVSRITGKARVERLQPS